MNKYLKEALWFCVPIVLTALLFLLPIINVNGVTTDINIYDTYFVISSITFFAGCLSIVGFIFYLVKTVATRYNNNISNIVFIIFNSILIFILTQFIVIDSQMNNEGWSIYPPLSAMEDKIPEETGSSFGTLQFIVLGFVMFLAFSAFMTGKKFNTQRNEI